MREVGKGDASFSEFLCFSYKTDVIRQLSMVLKKLNCLTFVLTNFQFWTQVKKSISKHNILLNPTLPTVHVCLGGRYIYIFQLGWGVGTEDENGWEPLIYKIRPTKNNLL